MNSISCFHFLLAYKLTGADTVSDVKSIGSIGVNCFVRLVNRSDLDCFFQTSSPEDDVMTSNGRPEH
ncbi:hypothetical protein KSF78_0007715 [Schistosoma japonicum]|nr:hypothetical protein KSF78_0007715 [Schistosoma japonicum]